MKSCTAEHLFCIKHLPPPYILQYNILQVSEVAWLCPTLCDPMDCSPPGSFIHGILQARVLEWVAIAFSCCCCCCCCVASVVSYSVQPHRLQPTRLLHPWDSPGKNTEVGCHSLFQGLFPAQGLNLGLPQCR